MSGFEIYHFHDTSRSSPIKQPSNINDNRFLRFDGSNIASFLFMLNANYPIVFKQIVGTLRGVAPFFDTFDIQPLFLNEESVQLDWLEVGNDKYFGPNQLSDGTIRMIGLITLLLQPNPPSMGKKYTRRPSVMTVLVLVEGQTEEAFIKNCLAPYFLKFGIYMQPIVVTTKRVLSGLKTTGGLSNGNLNRFLSDLNSLIHSVPPNGVVTTLIDFYALPANFPGYNLLNGGPF